MGNPAIFHNLLKTSVHSWLHVSVQGRSPFVALMDTMTNVVGVLTIVLVMIGISAANAVKKILSDLPPATAAQVAEAEAAIDKTKAQLAALSKNTVSIPNLPNQGDINAELIKLEAHVKEKNIKLFDLTTLNKELTTKFGEFSKQETFKTPEYRPRETGQRNVERITLVHGP